MDSREQDRLQKRRALRQWKGDVKGPRWSLQPKLALITSALSAIDYVALTLGLVVTPKLTK